MAGIIKCQCGDPVWRNEKHCLDCLTELKTGHLSAYASTPIRGTPGRNETNAAKLNNNDDGEDSPWHANAVRELEDGQ